jgi:prepilin-type N-terminal cleavage/methylation domain-containing protein
MGYKRGFTLIEVIIATLILTGMVASIFGAFVGAKYVFKYSRHKLQAVNFAREAQERLRSNHIYSDPELTVGSHPESDIGDVIKGEMDDLTDINLSYDVSEPEAGYKKITVNVSWEESKF